MSEASYSLEELVHNGLWKNQQLTPVTDVDNLVPAREYVFDYLHMNNSNDAKVQAAGVTDKGVQGYINTAKTIRFTISKSQELAKRHKARSKMLDDSSYRDVVGADPEIFVVDDNGQLLPSFKFLPAKSPEHVAYWDGFQAEFSVRPTTCQSYTIDYVRTGMLAVHNAAKKSGGKLTLKNVIDVPPELMSQTPPEFVQFGCTPSFNAYTNEVTLPDVDGYEVPFRMAGGHLHFSYQPYQRKLLSIEEAVKNLDKTIGVIAVSMFQAYDDPRRRTLYGKAGEFRKPKYGFEYRVLSNAWLCHPAIAHLIYDLARNSMRGIKEWDITEEEARTCIDTCDVALANKLLNRNIEGLKTLLATSAVDLCSDELQKPWLDIIFNGVHKYLRSPFEPSRLWCLDDDNWLRHSDGFGCNVRSATTRLITDKLLD